MHIGLSRLIRKNSGGEDKNPLYASASRQLCAGLQDQPDFADPEKLTLRLVVLDEAFPRWMRKRQAVSR